MKIKESLKIMGAGIIVMILAGSCEKELDFKYKDIDPILVIEGALTQNGAEVSLTYTTPMDEPMERHRLTDAKVEITDLTDGESFSLAPDNSGLYKAAIQGREGHRYSLTVERGESSYRAECEMLPAVEITGMAFNWVKMPYDDVAVLQVSFTDDPSTIDDCYWLRLYRNGKAYKWSEITDIFSSGGTIDKVTMTTRKDLDEEDEADRLEDGDIVTATVVSVSRQMYDYLEALAVGGSNGPRMFEGDFCLGYFLAAPVASREIVFRPEEIEYFQ